jgi:hypothetical protein
MRDLESRWSLREKGTGVAAIETSCRMKTKTAFMEYVGTTQNVCLEKPLRQFTDRGKIRRRVSNLPTASLHFCPF